ncbi:MAG: PmoA family protein, partial [bacterium]|nr:PmoA family protein [bacterium]
MLKSLLFLFLLWISPICFGQIQINSHEDSLQITIDNQPFATYVFLNPAIPRPFFHSLFSPGGVPITRSFPPVEGVDLTDHATFHPGLWLAFGDISGNDFWRNQAQVIHKQFLKSPDIKDNTGSFTVLNHYIGKDGLLCVEENTIGITPDPHGVMLLWDSVFYSTEKPFTFGDQEEMGLGIRMATPFIVENGGHILNSENGHNEKEIWGKQAAWCAFYKVLEDKKSAGVLLMPSPENFRPSWFHARDYGLLTANPFGRNAFTKKEKSKITVQPNERFSLRFGVYVFHTTEASPQFFQTS